MIAPTLLQFIINAKAFLSHVDCYVVSYVYTFVGSTLKWVLPTTLRVYGLRPSGKTKGSTLTIPDLRNKLLYG